MSTHEVTRGTEKRPRFGFILRSHIVPGKNIPRKYANPVYGRPTHKVHISYLHLFIGIALVAIVVYFLLFSSLFQISTMSVVNNRVLLEGDIQHFLSERNISSKNIFLLNTRQVREVLMDYYKRIEEVRVYKVLPAKIKIKIKEKPSTVVWQVGDAKYMLDNDGFVLGSFDGESDMPTVADVSALPVVAGDRIVTQSFIEFVNTVDESLKKRVGLGVVGYSVDSTTFELKAHINSGFYILFDTTASPVEQLDKLLELYKIGEIIHEYAILSIDGKVIVK